MFFYLYQKFRLSFSFLVYIIFASGLIIASFVDIEHRIIPDEISLGGIVVGLILSSLIPTVQQTSSMGVGFLRSFLGALIGGLIIYLTGLLGEAIFKKEAMGGGDVKFLAMIGAFLGWKKVLISFFIAPLFGALVGIGVKIKTKSSLIPYGPFLALGAWISLFWGEKILNMVLF
jgi:leader peptidase (prepilin peptidase)/N-methyltransferase